MIPYGKDNWRRNVDVGRGEYFAPRGYALCRLDVRGTGSSGGVALDEYTEDETLDGYDAVEWLAAQQWCDGNVGMWGISYGGFTSIQVAKLRPPHLRAIVPVMATDDRYTTDVHYVGGCVTASELSQYAVSQVAMNAMPPDVEFRGAGWLAEWRARLEATPPWLFEWLRHQRDGPYWRPGSLAPDYDAIDVPILNIGGWMDSYVDAALRMQALCSAPSRTIVGNWVHELPADGTPGPNLDELHEMVRFFDRWLRDSGAGAHDEPAARLVRTGLRTARAVPGGLAGSLASRRGIPPPSANRDRGRSPPGRCRWPAGSPRRPPAEAVVERYRHRPTTGTRGSLSWGAGGSPNGLARDLRPDEAFGPAFTSAPLDEPLSILGLPEVVLHLAVSAPVATAVVRLADVAPDGTSAQVTPASSTSPTGARMRTPSRSSPAASRRSASSCARMGYRFEAGHRIRVSVASSAWPVVWPSPFLTEFALHGGAATPSRLILPVVPPAGGPGDLPPPAFKVSPPDVPDVIARRIVRPAPLGDPRRRRRRQRHGHVPRRRQRRAPRRPPPVRGGDDLADRPRRRSGAGAPRRGRRLPLVGARPHDRDPGTLHAGVDGNRFRPVGGPRGRPRRHVVLQAALGGADPARPGLAAHIERRITIAKPATTAFPSRLIAELRPRRQALVGERAEGCQQQLPRRRGEGRTRDERRPFARCLAQLRPPEDQGREVQDRRRVEERDRQEAQVRPQWLARQLGVAGDPDPGVIRGRGTRRGSRSRTGRRPRRPAAPG